MTIQEQKFGIEVEMTGITREKAADIVAECLGSTANYRGGNYMEYHVVDDASRTWKLVYDSSIRTQTKSNNRVSQAPRDHSIELVTPICEYEDIERIQDMVRKLREGGAFSNQSCGIHIHINATQFEASKIRNLVNIIASKEDMFYKSLQVDSERENRFCKKVNQDFLTKLNQQKPKTREELRDLWYEDYHESPSNHYHDSRYHCLNLHSTFQKNTFEFRAFNGSLHAGKIKAYLQLCLGVTAQAYNQKSASPVPTKSTNEKYTFRTWLLRLGMIGDEFKTARTHLLNHLEGNIAWKSPEQAERQKQRLREKALAKEQIEVQEPQENQTQVQDQQVETQEQENQEQQEIAENVQEEFEENTMEMSM